MAFSWSVLKRFAFSGDNQSTQRLKTENQQRSFDDCMQFHFNDILNDENGDPIPLANTIIYRLVLSQPLNLIKRSLLLSSGGRRYHVYKAFGDEVITAGPTGFVDMNHLVQNRNANPPEGVTPPAAPFTLERAIDGTTLTVTENTILLPSSLDVIAGAQQGVFSSQRPVLSSDGDRLGASAGTYFVTMEDRGSTGDNVDGFYSLAFEMIS